MLLGRHESGHTVFVEQHYSAYRPVCPVFIRGFHDYGSPGVYVTSAVSFVDIGGGQFQKIDLVSGKHILVARTAVYRDRRDTFLCNRVGEAFPNSNKASGLQWHHRDQKVGVVLSATVNDMVPEIDSVFMLHSHGRLVNIMSLNDQSEPVTGLESGRRW